MMQRVKRLDGHQFWQLWRFAHDRKALGLADLGPFCPPRRFSAGLWRASRRAQRWQQCVHPATHLLRSRLALRVFPRTKRGLDQVACQHQVIVDNSHQVRPALKLCGRPHTRLFPQQRLFVEAIAMFLAKAQSIAQGDRNQIGLLIPNPDHPTHARITLGVGRMRAYDLDHRDLQPPSILDMHLLPPRELDGTARGILPLPYAIWGAMRRGILWLPFLPILARCPWFAGSWGSG